MDDFQELVYMRLQALPKGYSLHVGGVGKITKEQALKHVSEKDQVGKLLIAVDKHYFDLIKSGKIYEGITN